MIKNLAIGGGSNRVLLLLALLLGLISAILIGLYLSSLEGDGEGTAPVTTRTVVVAATDIPALTEITPEMLTVQAVPLDFVLLGAFTNSESAVGETTQVAIVAGEQLIQSRLTSPETALDAFGDNTPLSLIVPEGMRAFSVSVSSVGAAGGLIRAGDHVDLLLSGDILNAPEGGSLTPASACYVLQNIQVLAMDTALSRATSESDAAGIAAAATVPEASRATLAVSPNQAWQLAAVQGNVSGGGVDKQLWMSLRPFGDSAAIEGLPTCQAFAGS
jgi:pilus assembly protein CpaB